MLIFRSGKPQYLVSQPSSFLTCSMEKKCSPIHLTALHRSLPQSPRLSFSFSHIPSLLFAHLNALSPEFLCSASYICLIFASNSLGFQLFLSSVFSYFLHKLSSPPPRSSYSLHLAGLCPTNIAPLHLQLCLNWTEHICLRRSFKKGEKKKKKDKVQYSGVPAPEGPSQTRQQARRAFALQPIVLDPVGGGSVWGEQGSHAT